MGIGTGIVMLVVGAILRFAINLPNPVIDLGVVGVILMGAGFVALAVGIFFALRPKSTITTIVGNRAEALPPTEPYNRPSR
jgi:hypothetical protein